MLVFVRITYTDIEPMRPLDADIGIKIDFDKGKSDPVGVFAAMTQMLEAFHGFDDLLFNAVDPRLKPVMVLEDVEAASMTSWVKNKLEKVDDGALKEFSIRQQIGAYAVKAKYRILEYLDQREQQEERQRLKQLQDDLYTLARENAFSHFPLPDRIPLKALTAPMDRFQSAKSLLGPSDKVTVKSEDAEHSVNTTVRKKPSLFIGKDGDLKPSKGELEMTLLVRKPDFLGNTLWEFRHGKTSISAHIEDVKWLERFRNGLEPIVPGTSMACTVRYEYEYDSTGALISASHDVVAVHRLVPLGLESQQDLFDAE